MNLEWIEVDAAPWATEVLNNASDHRLNTKEPARWPDKEACASWKKRSACPIFEQTGEYCAFDHPPLTEPSSTEPSPTESSLVISVLEKELAAARRQISELQDSALCATLAVQCAEITGQEPVHSTATAVPLQQTVDMILQNRSENLELRAEVKRLRQQLVQQSNESEQRVKQLESELAALRVTSQEDQEMLIAEMTEYDKWAAESEVLSSPGVAELQEKVQVLQQELAQKESESVLRQLTSLSEQSKTQLLGKHLELKDAQMTIQKLQEHIGELGNNAAASGEASQMKFDEKTQLANALLKAGELEEKRISDAAEHAVAVSALELELDSTKAELEALQQTFEADSTQLSAALFKVKEFVMLVEDSNSDDAEDIAAAVIALESAVARTKAELEALQQTTSAGHTKLAAALLQVGELEKSIGEGNTECVDDAEHEAAAISLKSQLHSTKVELGALRQTFEADSTQLAASLFKVNELEKSVEEGNRDESEEPRGAGVNNLELEKSQVKLEESEQRVKQLESELAALRVTSREDQEMVLAEMTEYDKWAAESEVLSSPGVREEKSFGAERCTDDNT